MCRTHFMLFGELISLFWCFLWRLNQFEIPREEVRGHLRFVGEIAQISGKLIAFARGLNLQQISR